MFKDDKVIDSIVSIGSKIKFYSRAQKLEIGFKNVDDIKKDYPNANITVKKLLVFTVLQQFVYLIFIQILY